MKNFRLTYDYLCPFARNATESVLSGLAAGRDWDVKFHAFSLSQVHADEGTEVFADTSVSGVLAQQWGIAVRDTWPDVFPAAHRSLFAARHDDGLDISDPAVVEAALAGVGIDTDEVAKVVASGSPAETLRAEHTEAVDRWEVFGVPTFITGEVATFVRFMDRDQVEDVDRVLDLLGWEGLNEFKRTKLPR